MLRGPEIMGCQRYRLDRGWFSRGNVLVFSRIMLVDPPLKSGININQLPFQDIAAFYKVSFKFLYSVCHFAELSICKRSPRYAIEVVNVL